MSKIDLVVVGAGILGTAHALHALKAGKQVVLLEKDNAPQEATVRNFGQVVPSGMPKGRWQNYGRQSLAFYQEIQALFDIGIRNNGSYYLASNAPEAQLLEELHVINRDEEYPSELLSSAEIQRRFPAVRADYCQLALYFPQELSAEPRYTIHRLLAYLSMAYPENFVYQPNTAVIGCTATATGAQVTTATGQTLNAAAVIICSGREFRLLYPELFAQSPLEVSRLQMLQTPPLPQVALPGNILTGLTIRRYESFRECPSYAQLDAGPYPQILFDHGIHLLFKQARDGSIIIGDSHAYAPAPTSDAVGFDLDHEVNALMLAEAQKILDLPSWKIQSSWNGYYAQTKGADILQLFPEPPIQIVTGIGGKGMSTSLGFAAENIKKTFNF